MTYHPVDGYIPDSGFAVSIFPEDSAIIPVGNLEPASIVSYLQQHKEAWGKDGVHFGAWYDTDEQVVWLDKVVVLKDKDEAARLGVKHNQKAMYDIGSQTTVDLGGTGRVNDEGDKSMRQISKKKGDKGRLTVATVPRTPEELADMANRAYEAITGNKPTEEQKAEALAQARRGADD